MTLYQDTRERDLTGRPYVRQIVVSVSQPVPSEKFNWLQGTLAFGPKCVGVTQRITSWRTKSVPRKARIQIPRQVLSKDRKIRKQQLALIKEQGLQRYEALKAARPDPFKQWYRRALELQKRKVKRLLEPHPCMIWSRKVTSVQNRLLSFEKSRYGGWVAYAIQGDLAAYMASMNSPFLPANTFYADNAYAAEITRLMNRALIKTYAKLKKPAMPGLVYLGELTETLRMLRNPLSGLRALFSGLRRKTSQRRGSLLPDAFADQWLEYRYGIMPLIYQIQEIRDAFEQTVTLGYPVRMVRSGVKDKKVKSLELADLTVGGNYLGKLFVTDTTNMSAHCSLATTLQMDESRFLGLSWLDVPAAVWELIPYSFVVDWMFNIGEWIQAITPNPRLQVLSSTVSIKLEHVVNYEVGSFRWSSTTTTPPPTFYCGSGCKLVESKLIRVVHPTLPALPVGNLDFLNFKRSLDSLALLYGQAKRLLRR